MTREPAAAPASPFDELAPTYDETFTETTLGVIHRDAVWRHVESAWPEGARVLELGCGTGEDACHLARRGVRVLATDASPPMVAAARKKADDLGVASLVKTRVLRIEDVGALEGEIGAGGEGELEGDLFDGVLSNFGALNCVDDLAPVADALASLVRPGGRVFLCLMGRICLWETAYFALRLEPKKAVRRLSREGTTWRGLSVRYPTPADVEAAFAGGFATKGLYAIGLLVPPSYVEEWARRNRGLVRFLDAWERRIEGWPLLPSLSDHFLIELERRPPAPRT